MDLPSVASKGLVVAMAEAFAARPAASMSAAGKMPRGMRPSCGARGQRSARGHRQERQRLEVLEERASIVCTQELITRYSIMRSGT